jgi:hypothetical protein
MVRGARKKVRDGESRKSLIERKVPRLVIDLAMIGDHDLDF